MVLRRQPPNINVKRGFLIRLIKGWQSLPKRPSSAKLSCGQVSAICGLKIHPPLKRIIIHYLVSPESDLYELQYTPFIRSEGSATFAMYSM